MAVTLVGRCHCGNLALAFTSSRPPEELPVRICTCSFCRRHRPRYTSDPTGHVSISAHDSAELGRYRFGLALADFLICRRCGVFVAAYQPGATGLAVVNLDVLDDAARFTALAQSMTLDDEDAATRLARRQRGWIPATLLV